MPIKHRFYTATSISGTTHFGVWCEDYLQGIWETTIPFMSAIEVLEHNCHETRLRYIIAD